MDFTHIVLSLLAALGVASLTAFWLAETDPKTHKKLPLDSAAIDKVILITIITFAVVMVMHHPEWLT